jgi:branched-chain amino acid transport system ATP-binding protein
MLDEPSQGIMPKLVDEIFSAISEIRRAGITILIVEQRLTECLEIADRVYVLQTGRVILSGTSAEVRDNTGVRQAYLGL